MIKMCCDDEDCKCKNFIEAEIDMSRYIAIAKDLMTSGFSKDMLCSHYV